MEFAEKMSFRRIGRSLLEPWSSARNVTMTLIRPRPIQQSHPTQVFIHSTQLPRAERDELFCASFRDHNCCKIAISLIICE